MKQLFNKQVALCFLILFGVLTACSDDDEEVVKPSAPTMSDVEIGYGNNHQGVIGRDFHFNAEVVAAGSIDLVKINIKPKADEEYTSDWSFEISWDEFKGLKNSTIHKHFDIPEDAPEGNFDFIVTISDENGGVLEETYDFEIIDAKNLSVDPYLYIWMITTDQGDFHYVNETLENPEEVEFSKDEILKSDATINNVKGDGKMYLVLIRKDANHLPETIDAIDFSKVIVYDVFEHKDQEEVDSFVNVIYDGQGGYERPSPEFTIGTSADNNSPEANPIAGAKAWTNGEYYLGMIYTNTSYNVSVHHYVEVTLSGF